MESSIASYKQNGFLEGSKFPAGENAKRVIASDLAQSAGVPNHTDQAGPIYFKVQLNCQLFSLEDPARQHFIYYLADETETIGLDGKESHGPYAVISMVDYYLKKHDHGEKVLVVYCDNCAGQNRNRFLMAYWARLMKTDRYKDVETHFLLVGHTKFTPDALFGRWKKVFRSRNTDLPEDLKTTVGNDFPNTTTCKYSDEPDFKWFDWKTHLDERYEPVVVI
ncbi:hypothetical protein RvY_15883 [Ramazzottius varieornatus]|uniref:DUF7869 domain-containing protein n=1 Tax=Ramazzottius varieornatus TaxID=947166 RepID=A0A1D1W108_RAMVA|nr:hypothetical protein RvY_15883 [Ramazzottius varieornatus]